MFRRPTDTLEQGLDALNGALRRVPQRFHGWILLGGVFGFFLLAPPLAWLFGMKQIIMEMLFIVPAALWALALIVTGLIHEVPPDLSFMDLYMNGKVNADVIDDFVDRWCEGKSGSDKYRFLYEYLGMTYVEYCRWAIDPAALPDIREDRLKVSEKSLETND